MINLHKIDIFISFSLLILSNIIILRLYEHIKYDIKIIINNFIAKTCL